MLTIDARVELFKKQFPKEKVVSVQERQGTDHSVLEINHTWMCKSSMTQEGVALLDREARLLKLLQGKVATQIPVPVHYEENFLVYKKIAGSPLISYAFYRLGNKQRSKLILEVAQFLSQLHTALSVDEIASLHLAKSDWPWSFEKLQAHRHHLDQNKDLLEEIDEAFEANNPYWELEDYALHLANTRQFDKHAELDKATGHPLGLNAVQQAAWARMNPLLERAGHGMQAVGINPMRFG